jgi:hypothetical protein
MASALAKRVASAAGALARPIGTYMGAAGLATIVTGWFTATSGFGGAATGTSVSGSS